MSAGYTNLRVVNYRDTIAELIDRANQTHTRATGVQVFSPGDGMAYEDSEGFINPISPALFDDARDQIAEASESLVATEAELEAAQSRIDETTELLSGLDERSEATAAEAKAASERVAQAEDDLATAREELRAADAAASDQLAALDGRLDQNASELTSLSSTMEAVSQQSSEAQARAAQVAQSLTATDARLTATGKDLADLVPRVGSVESAVSASDARMTELSSAATAANQAAQDAMSAAEAAEARVQALANAQGSLIIAGGFETATTENAYYRYETASARTGKFVGRFMAAEGSPEVRWPEVRASKSQTLEMRFYATRFGEIGGAYPYGCLFYRDKNDQLTTLFPNSSSITPTVDRSWREYVWRFDPLPADARAVVFRSGIRGGSASDTGYIMLDDVTAHDTASYQEALDSALAAKKAAEDAAKDALNAMTRANAAYDSAAGKTAVRNATTAPQGVGTTPGDTWLRWSAFPGGVVTGQWSWDGTAWQVQQFSHQVQASVDLGKATVGQLHGSYVTAGSLGADRIAIGVGENALADPYFQDVVFSAERASTSLGAWTRKTSGSSITYTTGSTTDTVTFRYGGTNLNRVIPTTGGRNWHVSAVVDSGGGGARINVRWYNSLGASTYVIAAATTTGTGKRTISADWTAPEEATGFLFDVHFPGSSTARACTVYGGAAARAKTGSVLIEDGAVKAKQVDAQSVAGAVGQFVKVQANNVEVTEALSARVVEALSATSKRLVVTEDAILNRATVIQELVAPVVKATKVSTDQLIAGTASLDTATANKLFADIFAANKITAAQIVVGGLPSAALADGAVSAVKIADGAVTAGKVTATEELSAKILRATSAEVATQFVTDRLVIGTGDNAGVLEVLGKAITNDLNVRGKLRGRDAILAGTLDVKQLNVTEDMAAQIVSAMTVNTKKLVVTEAAVMQHVTAIEGIITPKITASEARIGDLLAAKASIADIQGGDLTLTGHFRSGAAGKPGVIIPQNYTTQSGMEQLGVWLSPSGVAPSLGSEWGQIAGIWLDQGSNITGSTHQSPLHIRGQSGAGVNMYGKMTVHRHSSTNAGMIKSAAGQDMQYMAASGKTAYLWGTGDGYSAVYTNGTGSARVQTDGSGDAKVLASGSGNAKVQAEGLGYAQVISTGTGIVSLRAEKNNVWVSSYTNDVNVQAKAVLRLRSDDRIAMQKFDIGGSYDYTGSTGSKVDLTIHPGSGVVNLKTSARRFKTDIQPFTPDPRWLDQPVVSYLNKQAVERWEEIVSDPTYGPLTQDDYLVLKEAMTREVGTIADDAADYGAGDLVAYDSDGEVLAWDYARETVVLRHFVREHRDKIADLESRIAELESALL